MKNKKWIVEFMNLPPKEQVEFIIRQRITNEMEMKLRKDQKKNNNTIEVDLTVDK